MMMLKVRPGLRLPKRGDLVFVGKTGFLLFRKPPGTGSVVGVIVEVLEKTREVAFQVRGAGKSTL